MFCDKNLNFRRISKEKVVFLVLENLLKKHYVQVTLAFEMIFAEIDII